MFGFLACINRLRKGKEILIKKLARLIFFHGKTHDGIKEFMGLQWKASFIWVSLDFYSFDKPCSCLSLRQKWDK